MSYNEYSPLDTTLPFFSNTEGFSWISTIPRANRTFTLAFLLKFKGIARRVRITNTQTTSSVSVFLNGSTINPIIVAGNGGRTLNQWITSITIKDNTTGNGRVGLIEFDIVPVQYLPPKQRRAL